MMSQRERSLLINRANTNAQTRLRRLHHGEFRAIYKEELAVFGIKVREKRESRVVELEEEVKRLQALLAETH